MSDDMTKTEANEEKAGTAAGPSIPERIEMTGALFNQIKHTVGQKPAETGGILGMSGDIISHFFFDRCPEGASTATYAPNCKAINARLKRWTRKGVVYMGAVHSHPKSCNAPSYPDREYARRLLENNLSYDNAKPYFYMPIVQSSAEAGEFTMHSFMAGYDGDEFSVKRIDLYVDGQKYSPGAHKPPRSFARVRSILPEAAVSRKTVVAIGAGGSRAYIESLARCGIESFVLMDGDTVSESNIATQGVYCSEIGRSKAGAVKERILDINPRANVVCVEEYLVDELSDEDFLDLVGEGCRAKLESSPKDVLIGGLTDSFHANARAARLALKYGAPYIEAGIYQNGSGAEIIFTYPGVTPSCARCANSARYNKYAEGYKNDVTSDGCPIFATDVLNGLKGHVSLMLLLHGTDTRYGGYLENYKTRNFIQMYFDPFSELFPGEQMGGVRYYEQKPDHPDNGYEQCPDCLGTGNLEDMRGKVGDTRKIFGQEV